MCSWDWSSYVCSSDLPTARFVELFSARYTPAVVLASILTILAPPLAFGADWHTWIYRGLALLLIGCPCALVLSTPAAVTSGVAAAARRGLLIKEIGRASCRERVWQYV